MDPSFYLDTVSNPTFWSQILMTFSTWGSTALEWFSVWWLYVWGAGSLATAIGLKNKRLCIEDRLEYIGFWWAYAAVGAAQKLIWNPVRNLFVGSSSDKPLLGQ